MTRLARDSVRELPHPLYDSALWVWQGVIFVQVVEASKGTEFPALFAAALNLRLPPDKGAPSPRLRRPFCKLPHYMMSLAPIDAQPHGQP